MKKGVRPRKPKKWTAAGKARAIANLKPAQPGDVRNPLGCVRAGATLVQWLNVFATKELTEKQLRAIAADATLSWTKRAAARRALATISGDADLADFAAFLAGEKDLKQLRAAGVDTAAVKVVRTRPGKWGESRQIQLHHTSGEEFDRICDRTDGRPTARLEIEAKGELKSITFDVPGLAAAAGVKPEELG